MRVFIEDDFNLDKIIYSGQCFRPFEKEGHYYFVYKSYILEIYQIKGSEHEAVCTTKEWEEVWTPYFDLCMNYSEIRDYLSAADDFLKVCTEAGKGIRILRQDKWEMLISFIISQRKSIPAIRSSVEKLCRMYGQAIDKDIYTFPTVQALSQATEAELSACGLGYRIPYIMDAAKLVNSGEIPLENYDRLPDDMLFGELKKIRGVGDKVANCVELFGFHRIERAPVDTWIAKVINEQYSGINPFDSMQWAGIAQQYMFYYAQNVSRKNT